MLSPYKVVFFDAGGTLLHPYPSVGEIYSEVASRYGSNIAPDQIERVFREAWVKQDGMAALVSHSSEKVEKDWWHAMVLQVFSELGGIPDFENFFEELFHLFGEPKVWRLYPETKEVLDELLRRKKRLAIVSNWDSRLFHLIEWLGLQNYFEFILASAVFGASKPNPRIFKEALGKIGVAPSEAVHVGDSLEDDIKGATGVGMQSVLIARNARTVEHKHFKGLQVIRDLRELL